jgi:hypothetical protein
MAIEKVSLKEIIHFLPRQVEATKAADTHKYTLYGGSAGPGKSYWLRWYPIYRMIRWGKELGLTGIHSGLFSKDYGTLKDRQISKMEVEFPKWLGEVKASQTEGLAFHLKPEYGGHVLALRNLDDPSKYLSSEFAIIAIEELTENDIAVFHTLRGRNRWTGIEDTKVIAATNPGGQGHAGVKKLWIDRDFPEELLPEAKEFIYVRALPADNPYLAASYLRTLDSLPEKLRKAYRDGNWDVFEGQYFAEWDRDKHVCEPFEIPEAWPRFISIDPSGRSGITSCHWYTVNRDGTVYAYREHYATGMDIDQHAEEIAKLSKDKDGNDERYSYGVIDSAAFAKAGYSETAVEIFMRHGVGVTYQLLPAAKERIVGWNDVHQFLRWTIHTPPKFKAFKTCYNLIRTIPLLQHDEIHPEDVDSRGEDHCLTGDTLVDTRKGQRTIKELVGKDGHVATLVGWKHYHSVRMTGQQQDVFKVTLSDGRSFKGTATHPVLTTKGWKEVRELDLVHDAVICLDTWNQSSSPKPSKSLTESDTISAVSIFKEKDDVYMLECGKILMEKWREEIMSIIKTTTDQTIVLEIWKNYLGSPTCPFMQSCQRVVADLRNPSLNTEYRKREHGTLVQLDQSGTENMPKRHGNIGSNAQKYANGAREDTRPIFQADRSSAISIAKCEPCGKEDVYNLTVPSVKHFSVNGGIIVHNCADELRYFLRTLRDSKAPKLENAIEKRIRKLNEGGEDFWPT